MKSTIFIPKKINVGFQKRSSTYTGKLAYIIYYDQKNVLRKQTSWESWRDKSIPNEEFDNEPTSGFVLNKKVGDYVSDWNHRQAYVRVYDPRNFEFEITIENLLYILENTSSIKGKGLEGSFVYGWDSKNLILIPTSSPDYIEISEFNKILHEKNYIKSKELKVGATYRRKDNEEWIYMGRFDYHTTKSERIEHRTNNSYWGYSYEYKYTNVNKGKRHYFVRKGVHSWNNEPYLSLLILKSLGDKFISVVSDECVDNYADLFDQLECKTEYSPYDETKDEYVQYEFSVFADKVANDNYGFDFYDYTKDSVTVRKSRKDPSVYRVTRRDNSNRWGEDILLHEDTIKNIFNLYQPMYKNKYLANGKLYQKGE